MERAPRPAPPVPAPDPSGNELKWWRNKGGTFRLNKKRVIKPNQTFQARESEIAPAFRDIIVPVVPRSTAPVEAPVPPVRGDKVRPSRVPPAPLAPVEVVKSEYRAVKDEATGHWHIVDSQEKVITEQPIADEQEAIELAKSLSS